MEHSVILFPFGLAFEDFNRNSFALNFKSPVPRTSISLCHSTTGPITIIETDELINEIDFSLLFTGLDDGVACIDGRAETLECGCVQRRESVRGGE